MEAIRVRAEDTLPTLGKLNFGRLRNVEVMLMRGEDGFGVPINGHFIEALRISRELVESAGVYTFKDLYRVSFAHTSETVRRLYGPPLSWS